MTFALRHRAIARAAICCLLALATSASAEAVTPMTLGTARAIFVDSHSVYLKSSLLEERLQGRPEFAKLGLTITRDASAADVVVEVHRSNFTTKFDYSVVDSRTRTVLASGQVNSLFGTAAGKIAKKLVKQIAARRAVDVRAGS